MLGYRVVEIEQASAVGHGHRKRRHSLGRREHRDEGVALPGLRPPPVAMTAPEVDHQAAVAPHGAGRTYFAALLEVACEGIRDRLEPCLDVTADHRLRH